VVALLRLATISDIISLCCCARVSSACSRLATMSDWPEDKLSMEVLMASNIDRILSPFAAGDAGSDVATEPSASACDDLRRRSFA